MSKRFSDQYKCAHAWAHQHEPAGQASSLFFEGPVIYSYGKHFPIAMLSRDKVFFTDKEYSKSTGKHKHIVKGAVSHKTFVYVPHVPISLDQLSSLEWQDKNIIDWIKRIESDLKVKQAHPRKHSIDRAVRQHIYDLNTFCEAIGRELSTDLKKIAENPDLMAIQALEAKAEAARSVAIRAAYKVAIKNWRTGKIREIPFMDERYVDNNLAYLRYNATTRNIETSKRIEVPEDIAHHFWLHIQRTLPAGSSDSDFTILDFKVKAITPKKIVVGCHTIQMSEAERIARQLKWTMRSKQQIAKRGRQ